MEIKEEFNVERQIFERVKSSIQSEMCLRDIQAMELVYFMDSYTRKVKTRLITAHYERHAETKEIEFELERPRFLDWLLRRRKTQTIRVELKEVLKESKSTITQNPFIEIMAIKE